MILFKSFFRILTLVLILFNLIINPGVLFSQSVSYGKQSGNESCEVEIISLSNEKIRLKAWINHYSKDQVKIGNQTWYVIKMAGEAFIKNKSYPELPKISRSIQIPKNADISVNVINETSKEIKLQVAPSKGILSRLLDPDSVPYKFGEIYKKDVFYPVNRIDIGQPYNIRDVRGVNFNIYPFAYNPVRKVLRIYTSLEIEIMFNVDNTVNSIGKPKQKRNRFFEPLLRRHFINYELWNNYSDYSALEDTGKMLVICYDEFMDEILPLVYFKNNRGLVTDTVSMSVVGNTSTDIESYIQDYYNNDSSLTFVLLVGDHNQVPSLFYNGGGSDPSFSLVSGSDNYPDIIIGRFSAQTEAQVETIVERTIFYENMLEKDWFHNGMGIASDDGLGFGDDNEYDWEHLRNIRTDLLNYHYTSVSELYDGDQGGADAPGDPTDVMVSDEVNNGVSIINYTGHGSTIRWTTSGFSNSDVNALINDSLFPFVFSVACYNGNFTGTTCFAETWLRAINSSNGMPAGAIGFYGSSIDQDWSPPMEAQDEFNALLVDEENISFGALCYNGSCSMMDKYGSGNGSSGAENFLTWHIFGDPSLSVIPNNLGECRESLTISDSINGGNYIFKASDSIVASGTLTDSSIVKYSAGNRIRFLPGFSVTSGCSFTADNTGCTAVVMNPEAIVKVPVLEEAQQYDKELNDKPGLVIYPNPVKNDFFYVKIPDNFNLKNIKVYNSFGELIYKQANHGKLSMIKPVKEKGLILVRLEFDDNIVVRKIIVL